MLFFAIGCGGESSDALPVVPAPCEPPALLLGEDNCIRPGVPPDGCAEGFVHDGEYGCHATLPAEVCPVGQMAVPGDAACRPVMPCPGEKWGDIELAADTMYVDARYPGTDSDGSAARPWRTIGEAYEAAASGAMLAIAEGSYLEDPLILGKPVRLMGVCPEKVELVGGLRIFNGAGTEVHRISIRKAGIYVTTSPEVLIDRVWLHGSALVLDAGASVKVIDSLIEKRRHLSASGSSQTRAPRWRARSSARFDPTRSMDSVASASIWAHATRAVRLRVSACAASCSSKIIEPACS